MEKYTVNITATFRGFIEVEANSREEALSLAETEYWNGNVYLNNIKEEFTFSRRKRKR